MAISARRQNYITLARGHARDLWEAYQELLALQAEWNAQDYTNTMVEPDDFAGENEGLTIANISSVVFDTTNAIKTNMDAGHATNVTNIL